MKLRKLMTEDLKLKRWGSSAGFTMIELIIVFGLIGLLSSYMLGAAFLGSKKRARDSERKTQLKQLAVALEQFVNDHGQYPLSSPDGEIVGCGSGAVLVACSWGEAFVDNKGTIYMGKLPKDRLTATRRYYYRSDGLGWQIFARLEDERDPVLDWDGDGDYDSDDEAKLPAYAVCDTSPVTSCNYGISSGTVTIFDTL